MSLLPTLVRKEDVPNAVALNSMQFNLARVIGPVLAGFAFVGLGAAACFALNGLSFVAVIAALLLMGGGSLASDATAKRESVLHEMREGFAFVTGSRALRQLCLLGFAGTFVLIGVFEKFAPKAPTPLIAVAGGILASALLGLKAQGLSIVGAIPGGFPSLTLPDPSLAMTLWPAG